jgi:antitoxin VapB
MVTAKVLRSGNSQAVRRPEQFRLDATKAENYRSDDEIVLRELAPDPAGAFEILCALADDMLADRRDGAPETREGL